MKKYLDIFIKWSIFGLWIIFVVWISYIIIKAWNSSSSWLPMDSNNPAALYVDSNETLTAAKRNRLVQKSNREEVATSNTDPFDTNCERKWQIENWIYDNTFFADNLRIDWTKILVLNGPIWVDVINTNKWNTVNHTTLDTLRPNLHVRKRCN